MSKKLNLFDGDSDDDGGDASLSVNKDYAKRYEAWREAEVKEHLKNKVASGFYDDSDGSSSEEGEPERDPEELKQVLSKDFFQLISDLKKKDPKIYDRNVEFFKHEKDEQTSPAGKASKKQSKEKPLYLRDYERKIITERQGELSDESDTEITEDPRSQSPTYVEEQRQLKESFKKALYDDEGSGDEGGLLKKKEKTKAEKKKEEEDYIEWLKGNKASLPDKETEASLKELKTAWNDPNLDEDEKFLRDYVLNRRYLKNHDVSCDEGNVRDDDYEDKYMDTFEQKYNFRYEEPDKEFLKRFPRTMEQSVRHRDTTRKEKRDALKKRKEQEKLVKQEELKLLKSLKRKEIIQKIEQIKQITGNDELGLNADDLEDEFDPEAHDEKMKAIFNDDYYQCEDDAEDEEGLHLPPLGEELLDDDDVPEGNWDNWDNTEQNDGTAVSKEEEYVPHCEDPEFNMDCDYDPATATARKESKRMSSREKRKLKRQSRFGRLVHKEKPVFDPKDKTFQQYVDEYYGMDYEDLIGDMPCRFKYKSVFPNSFGLTIDEILAADDKELNQWVSIKKAYTIRPESAEKYDAKVYAEKAKNEELKRKILPSLYKHEIENVNENNEKQDKKKRKKKKKKHNTNESENGDSTLVEGAIETVDQATLQAEGSSRNKKKKHHIIEAVDQDPSTSQAQDSHKKKKKKHQLITDEDGRTGVAPIVDTNQIISQAEGSGKKKKKKHQLITDEDGRTGVAPVGDANQITSQAEGSGKKKKKKDFNESVTAHAQDVSNETTNNERKRKHSDSGEHQNGWKKAKTNFGQRGAGQKNGMGNVNQEQNISDSRLKAYGLNPKRYKKFQKYGPKN